MHATKFAQLAPIEKELATKALFILASWNFPRIERFNDFVKGSGRDWTMLKVDFPLRFWLDLFAGLPFWATLAFTRPKLMARRITQYFELYGIVFGFCRIMSAAQAEVLFSCFEDSFYSSALALVAKKSGFKVVNAMHGNAYYH
ncbi:MAG: hypothetical protein ABIY63_17645, partial [Fibrobacteria bacterium]